MSRNVSIETIVIIALAAALFIVLTLLVLLRIRGKLTGSSDALELLGRRLDQMDGLAKDVGALSQLFLIPHARGGIGETLLGELLRNWLPNKAYELQYGFPNGTRVDAVIRLGEYLVPIDAKFPLESVRRSIEENPRGEAVNSEVRRSFTKHAEAIQSKYIRPEDGTLQFALMYIPSERVYYHAFVEADSGLLETALQIGVVPVSPGGLFLYLQTVAYGLKGLAFSRRQRELVQITLNLKREVENLKRLTVTGNSHLRNLLKIRDESDKKIDDIARVLEHIDFNDADE